jgi:hypothetical protein
MKSPSKTKVRSGLARAAGIVLFSSSAAFAVGLLGCASAQKTVEAPGVASIVDIPEGQSELWVDQRCRREARRWSKLTDKDYIPVAEEKRFLVTRKGDRILVRPVDAEVELEAQPSKTLPGTYEIRSASGGVFSLHGGRGGRAELVLFGASFPYLSCDRGTLRTASL